MSRATSIKPLRLAVIALMTLLLCAGTGCSNLRKKIRENERQSALSNVRAWHGHRDWERCLASAERAQATADLEIEVARETTLLKANCLYQLDRKVEAYAHYLLLRDFLQEAPDDLTFPAVVQKRVANAPSLEVVKAMPYNQALLTVSLPGARFTRAAKWSGISGQVLLQWTITKQGIARHIRVLDDIHPLLAGLAIEAAASSVVDTEKIHRELLPITKRSRISFGER